MGRSTTPKYRVEMRLPGHSVTPAIWSVKAYGKPTDDNLAAFIEAWDKVGMGEGLPMIAEARIVLQVGNATVATYKAPMFKAV